MTWVDPDVQPDMPLAGVIIPAYNAAHTLPATLAALRAQTIPAAQLEVIVVDDGSTDATAAVAAAAGVRVVRRANGGPAAARNQGAAAARSPIVLFTDADCVPAPDWVAAMLAPFRDPTVVGVKGAYRTHQRSLVARFAQIEFLDRYARQAQQPTIDLVDSYAAAFRRAAFLAAGGYHPGFIGNEDVELSYRLADGGARLVFAPAAVVYHTHAATLGRYLRVKVNRGYWRILVYRRYPHKVLRDSYTPQVLKAQVALVGALAGCAGPALVWPPLRPVCAALAGSLLASTLPFTAFAARYDP
ncbi:MAG: glycosyltransferase family 2 protein, partial [Chloroflexota bacterium]|nr:glycosyltransferase family 2 protein [Chloroflexota bacterium]